MYQECTMKTTVIAFPGTLCSPAIFRPTEQALADICNFNTISWMDEPENGTDKVSNDSPAHSIQAIADRTARTITHPAILIGHSTGGAIAAYLAATYPHLARGLVLVNTGAHMRRHGDVAALIAALRQEGGKDDLAAAVLARSFATPPSAAALAEFERYAAGVAPRAVLEALQSQAALDLAPLLAQLRCPMVVVHGVLDCVRSKGDAEELRACVDGAVVRWAECGHSPVYESPQAVAAAVKEVMARLT